MTGNLVNFVAFQVGWFSSVVGAGRGWTFLGPAVVAAVLVLHLVRSSAPVREARFLVAVAVIGTAVDSLLAASGLVVYRGGYGVNWIAPAWITAMWLNFGTTIHASLAWLADRHRVAGALGAVGGPLTYLGAARLGAVDIVRPTWSLIALGLTWAAVLPSLFWMSKKPGLVANERNRDSKRTFCSQGDGNGER
jgi:hypothetical protein